MIFENDFLYPISLKKFKEITSTNDYLKENRVSNWTFIWADYQNKGRGSEGNWRSQKGKNLTFSFYLTFCQYQLKLKDYFLLNVFICNALHKTFFSYDKDLFIKWPNDILLKNKKIAGILIENKISKHLIKSSIIGIGINVNQMKFDPVFKKASSLKKELGIEFDLNILFKKLVENIQKEYQLLKESEIEKFKSYYINHLYKKGESCLFKHKEKIIKADLIGLDNEGKLLLQFEKEKKTRAFKQKEIALIY